MWYRAYTYVVLVVIGGGCAASRPPPPSAVATDDNAAAAGQTDPGSAHSATQAVFTSAPNKTLVLITEPGPAARPVLRRIRAARKSVDLVMYELEDPAVTKALEQAAARGVHVRVLMNGGYYGKKERRHNGAAYAALSAHHVPVRWTPSRFALTHQKTLVVDGDDALVMTFNLVPKYYATSRDFAVDDRDAADVQAIARTFNADWRNVPTTAPHGDDLLWSPGSRQELVSLIAGATKSLEIYNEEMADPVVTKALVAAAHRGVHVSIVMTQSTHWRRAWRRLTHAGAHVRVFARDAKLYIHAKAVIADRKTGFVGSENFSWTSLVKNRELGIVTADATIINGIERAFARDWRNAKPWS